MHWDSYTSDLLVPEAGGPGSMFTEDRFCFQRSKQTAPCDGQQLASDANVTFKLVLNCRMIGYVCVSIEGVARGWDPGACGRRPTNSAVLGILIISIPLNDDQVSRSIP